MTTEFKPIPSFNPHTNCKGHGMSFLECEYTKQEERDLLVRIIDNYLSHYETELKEQSIKISP